MKIFIIGFCLGDIKLSSMWKQNMQKLGII